jgi:hypothetical protein
MHRTTVNTPDILDPIIETPRGPEPEAPRDLFD